MKTMKTETGTWGAKKKKRSRIRPLVVATFVPARDMYLVVGVTGAPRVGEVLSPTTMLHVPQAFTTHEVQGGPDFSVDGCTIRVPICFIARAIQNTTVPNS